jgi:hypothetical protein
LQQITLFLIVPMGYGGMLIRTYCEFQLAWNHFGVASLDDWKLENGQDMIIQSRKGEPN